VFKKEVHVPVQEEKRMRQLLYVAIALVLSAVPALSQATTLTTNIQSPVNFTLFVSCAAGGAGEWVSLAGSLHFLSVVTIDANAGVKVQVHFQPMGVGGTGLTTGDKYRGNGVTRTSFSMTPAGTFLTTFINRFNIIGQGRGNNFVARDTVHMTVLADGTTTATVDNFAAECK
jgi:hypothetical protein